MTVLENEDLLAQIFNPSLSPNRKDLSDSSNVGSLSDVERHFDFPDEKLFCARYRTVKENSAWLVSKAPSRCDGPPSRCYGLEAAEENLFVVEELRLSLTKAAEDNIEIRRALDECLTENADLRQTNRNREEIISQSSLEILSLRRERQNLLLRFAELEESLSHKDNEITELRRKLETVELGFIPAIREKELSRLEYEAVCLNLNEELVATQDRLSQLDLHLKRLSVNGDRRAVELARDHAKDISAKDKIIETLKARLSEMEQKLNSLEQEIKDITRDLGSIEEIRRQSMRDYATLMRRISILTNAPRVDAPRFDGPRVDALNCREITDQGPAQLMKENEFLYRRLSADGQPQDGSHCHFQAENKSRSGGESPNTQNSDTKYDD